METAAVFVSGLVVAMMLSSSVVAVDAVALPPLPQETHELLQECARKIDPEYCGDEIRLNIFVDGIKVSHECCRALLAEGKDCHDKFVEVTAPFYNAINQAEAKSRSLKLWDNCTDLVAAPIN